MGNLLVPPPGDPLQLGRMTGPSVLGTDLSDDHPVSFVYDATLAVKHPGIVDPANVPKALKLDGKQQMQCTTCHNAHESKRPKFLRMDNQGSAMCLACHQPPRLGAVDARDSPATWKGTGTNPWPADGATDDGLQRDAAVAIARTRRATASACSPARSSRTTATCATAARWRTKNVADEFADGCEVLAPSGRSGAVDARSGREPGRHAAPRGLRGLPQPACGDRTGRRCRPRSRAALQGVPGVGAGGDAGSPRRRSSSRSATSATASASRPRRASPGWR